MMEACRTPLSVDSVVKTYPNGLEAIRGVSLEVSPGEVFGLVGPNGAGKTTLLKVVSGLLYPESGSVACGGVNVTSQPQLAARYIGLMPDPLGVYTDISARDYLTFFANIMDLDEDVRETRIAETVDLLGLGPWLDEEVETLSAGWQRRLALGRVLMADVPVLLLDEPAAGLDVGARTELLDIVKRLAATNCSIVISSHILPELQQLADRFGIINDGRWVPVAGDRISFTREELLTGFGSHRWQMRCSDPDKALGVLTQQGCRCSAGTRNEVEFMADDEVYGARMLRCIMDAGIDVFEFRHCDVELSEVVLETLSGGQQ